MSACWPPKLRMAKPAASKDSPAATVWIRPAASGALPFSSVATPAGANSCSSGLASRAPETASTSMWSACSWVMSTAAAPSSALSVSEKVPGSSTSTRPSFSIRTQAWVNFVSFIRPAYGAIRSRVHGARLVIWDPALTRSMTPSEASFSMSQGATTGGSQAPAEAPAEASAKELPAGKEQRVTKQRLAVSAALDELDDFVSTQELHRILQERGTSVSLATSYRILQSLADDGLVDVLRNADGEVVYRRCAVTGHHHHLLCRNCGKAVEVEAPAVEAWAARIASEHGFTAVEHTVEIFGLCPDCTALQAGR